jgi:hypothetical protein
MADVDERRAIAEEKRAQAEERRLRLEVEKRQRAEQKERERERKEHEREQERRRREEEKRRRALEMERRKAQTEEVKEMRTKAVRRLRVITQAEKQQEWVQRKRQRAQVARERDMTVRMPVQSAEDVDPTTVLLETTFTSHDPDESIVHYRDTEEALQNAENFTPREQVSIRRPGHWFEGYEELSELRDAVEPVESKEHKGEVVAAAAAAPLPPRAPEARPPPPPPPDDDGGDDGDGDHRDEEDEDEEEADDYGDQAEEAEEGEEEGEGEEEEKEGKEERQYDGAAEIAAAEALQAPGGGNAALDELAANLGADAGGGGGGGGDAGEYEAMALEGTNYNWCAGMTPAEIAEETRACLPDPDFGYAPYCILCLTEPWSVASTTPREDGSLSPVALFYKYINELIRNAVGFDQRVRLIQRWVHTRLRPHLRPVFQNKHCALAVIAAHYDKHDLSARAVVDKQLRQLATLQNTLAKTGVMMRHRATGATCLDLKATKVLIELAEKQVSFALRHESMIGAKRAAAALGKL